MLGATIITLLGFLSHLPGNGLFPLALPAAVLALSIGCFAGFAWAIRGHFRPHGRMQPGMRLISALSLAGFLWFLAGRFLVPPPGRAIGQPQPDAAAVLLIVLSLWLFWASIRVTRGRLLTLAFAGDVPAFLQHRGPYRYVRHPFYLSYLLFWIATALASPSPLHWGVPAVMGLIYVEAARREESKFAASPLAPDYQAYRRRTGMLVPRLWRVPARRHDGG